MDHPGKGGVDKISLVNCLHGGGVDSSGVRRGEGEQGGEYEG